MADELFKKLGFKRIETRDIIEYYGGDEYFVVRFWRDKKQVELFGGEYVNGNLENNLYFVYGFELFKAINKQIEELEN